MKIFNFLSVIFGNKDFLSQEIPIAYRGKSKIDFNFSVCTTQIPFSFAFITLAR